MAEDDEDKEFHEGNPWNEGPDPEELLPSEEGTKEVDMSKARQKRNKAEQILHKWRMSIRTSRKVMEWANAELERLGKAGTTKVSDSSGRFPTYAESSGEGCARQRA